LRDYSCIFLNNVRQLDEPSWQKLFGYVRDGGGLVVALGHRADPANYSGATAARMLPATVERPKAPAGGRTSFGKVEDYNHPIFARPPEETSALDTDLGGVEVTKYMAVSPVPTNSRTLLSYQDGAPALLERDFVGNRTGRVLLWTTPLSRRLQPDDPGSWNDFPLHWSFLDLTIQSVPFLAGVSSERWDYQSGEFITIPVDPARRFTSFLVQGPGDSAPNRLNPPVSRSTLVIEPPQALGFGSVTASGEGRPTTYGFSVNPDPGESALSPMEPRDLDAIFGKGRYALADDTEGLIQAKMEIRVGRELFPWLMALILLLVTAENYLANRFYRERAAAPLPAPARAPSASA
jgi:hypothetical protein